jgi:Ca2+-binding RTX toxin-like protein
MVTGGSGNDQLAGVPQTGTTAASLGRGQIDTLSGGAGSDRFLLADSRGTFYNDGSSRSQGTSDYARITDFNPNQDVLQLRSGSQYLYRYSASYTEIFLGNGDTRFTTADELIARLEGVNLTPGTGVYTVATNTSWASFV